MCLALCVTVGLQDRKAREEEKERQKKKEEEEEEARKEKEGGGDTTAAAEPANGEEGKGSEGGGEGEAPKATPIAAEDTPTTSGPPPPEAKATPPEDEDPITVASRLRCQGNTDASSMEKTFASLNISRTLYTLAAVLPADLSVRQLHMPTASLCVYSVCVFCSCRRGWGEGGRWSSASRGSCSQLCSKWPLAHPYNHRHGNWPTLWLHSIWLGQTLRYIHREMQMCMYNYVHVNGHGDCIQVMMCFAGG